MRTKGTTACVLMLGFALSVFTPLIGCKTKTSSDYPITIRNDIQDSSFNDISITKLKTADGPQNFRAELSPGDEVVIPHKRVVFIRFERKYSDRTRIYEVSCPSTLKESVVLKLIDVHLNRLPGGCVLRKAGVLQGGSVDWSEER